jgi:hypothetical protein
MNAILRIAVALVGIIVPHVSGAATCTLTGGANIEPLDSYYCDTAPTGGSQSCTYWNEVNLDSSTKPMQYMRVYVRRTSDNSSLGSTFTNSAGQYALSFTLPACNENVNVTFAYKRVHESDTGAATPRWRFRIVPSGDGQPAWGTTWTVPLTGSTTTYNRTWQRTTGIPGISTRLANFYFTANSAISEMVTWTANLSAQFANTSEADGEALRIIVHEGYDPDVEYASQGGWYIWQRYDNYNRGFTTRHELGHIAHYGLHARNRTGSCSSYRYYNDTIQPGHTWLSCEWGQASTSEAIANFLAVRSITAHDTNSWFCNCRNNANQDTCSEAAIAPDGDDRVYGCQGGSFAGIGDAFATTTNHCTRVLFSQDCNCVDANGDGNCDSYGEFGWRNEIQVSRFLWDIIDANNENGNDDTDESMVSLADLFEAVTCEKSSPADFGLDGTCNEPNRWNSADCDPLDDTGFGVTPMQGTRDSYNAYDIGDLVPGNQTTERQVNCVDDAGD